MRLKVGPVLFALSLAAFLAACQSIKDVQEVIALAIGGDNITQTIEGLQRYPVNVRYPREGHDLSRTGEPNLRIDRLLRILEFFDRYVSPDSPTAGN